MAASAEQISAAINAVCQSKGGNYARYRCQAVSWDDVSRGTSDSLSCWGSNITDTYLKSKSGAQLFTVRPDNWDECLGAVKSEDVALVASKGSEPLRPVTLRAILQDFGEYAAYAGLDVRSDLADADLDSRCSIRFQTTFLPVEPSPGPQSCEFVAEAYNYNTLEDANPCNLILLCTSQGIAVQQDGVGIQRLFHHAVDAGGAIHRYWLEAEETKHGVAREQRESAEERADALARGKATSSVIGVRAMGQRFNALMTIQVPLKQAEPSLSDWSLVELEPCQRLEGNFSDGALYGEGEVCRSAQPLGSTAARVSRGSEFDIWPGLCIQSATRHPSEHVTVTIVMYNVVSGGVPSARDVIAAIDDLETLYQSCMASGNLSDSLMDFMKTPLSEDTCAQVKAKLQFKPPSIPVHNYDVFPMP